MKEVGVRSQVRKAIQASVFRTLGFDIVYRTRIPGHESVLCRNLPGVAGPPRLAGG